jgi:hypothetical protein
MTIFNTKYLGITISKDDGMEKGIQNTNTEGRKAKIITSSDKKIASMYYIINTGFPLTIDTVCVYHCICRQLLP